MNTTHCPDCNTPGCTVEIPGIYDGGLFYECPRGGRRWHRWSSGISDFSTRLHDRAEPFVRERPTCRKGD